MQPEPSDADVQAVAAAIGQQPVADPAPQLQPEAPTPQPAPTQQPAEAPTDPFAAIYPTEPVATEPVAPVEPAAPVAPTPEAPQAPAQTPAPQDQYQSYEDYMKEALAGVPEVPEKPDPTNINPDDPEAIKGFFDDLVNTAVARATAETKRAEAIQASERKLWDDAMDTYGTLRTNKELRDTVHNIRMANFQRGIAMTPTQAAQSLLKSLGAEYQRGVQNNQVVTTIESVQPTNGGGGAPIETNLDRQNVLESVQSGGETALADYLDQQIKAGRL